MSSGEKITFDELTARVARRANVSESQADAYIHQLTRTAGDALRNGDDVKLYRFGRFYTTYADERAGHDPNTGEALTVPAQTRVDFQPYKALQLGVNLPFRNLRTRMLPEREIARRGAARPWLLSALAVLALILAGFGLYAWMAGPDDGTAAPAQAPAATEPEQPASGPTPDETTTETDTGSGTGTDTATEPESEPDTGTGTAANTGTDTDADTGTDTDTSADAGTETDTGTDTGTATAADAPAEPAAATTSYVVEPGDTLWDISEAQWDDPTWWPVIYSENRADLTAGDPDLIQPGTSLRIPVLEGSADQPTDADLKRRTKAYRIVADDYEQVRSPRAAEYRRFVNHALGD